MSNNYWDEEDDDFDGAEPVDGSDLVKKLRKAKRADEKRIKELTEQLEGFTKKQREEIVQKVLEKKGVPTKAARLILKELDDVNEEAVTNWLEDNGDIFGYKPTEENSTKDLAALRQQDVLTQGAFTPDKAQDLETRLNNATSEDEILSLLRTQE